MQVLIEVNDQVYYDIEYRFVKGLASQSSNYILESAIYHGKVLPESHGDLIDRDHFTDKYAGCGNVYCEATSCKDCNSRIVNKFDVDSAPAIIPSNKGMCDGCELKTDSCQEGLHCPKEI